MLIVSQSYCNRKLVLILFRILDLYTFLFHFGIVDAEKLIGEKLEATEVSQSEIGQKQKLRVVLDKVNRILNLPSQWSHAKWSVDSK